MPRTIGKHKLNVPSRWNIKEAKELIALEDRIGSSTARIHAFFASLNDQPVGHGRNRAVVPHENISRSMASMFVREVHKLGKRFIFLANGPFEDELTKPVLDYLKWVVVILKPDAVMVCSPALIRWFLDNSNLEVHVSSIANMRSREELQQLFGLLRSSKRGISTVVLGQDTSRSFENFSSIAQFARFGNPFRSIVSFELLVNETCLFGCGNRIAHHTAQVIPGLNMWPDSFQHACNQEKIVHPDELLRAGGLLPPQLLDLYYKYGIGTFKIAGRELPFEVVKKATEAYLTGSFKGNIIELTAMTPPQISGPDGRGASDYFYVDTEALARLIRSLSQTKAEEREALIRKKAIEMHGDGLLRIGNIQYSVVDGRLTLVQ